MKRLFVVAIFTWLAVTALAMMSMYRLWWTRERALYAGRSALAKQEAIFARAGLPVESGRVARDIRSAWPQGARYEAHDSEVTLSYVKYLILPRIPDGQAGLMLTEKDGHLNWSPAVAPLESRSATSGGCSPSRAAMGWIMSILVVAGVALLLTRKTALWKLSGPEAMAVAIMVITNLGILSRGMLGRVDPAFSIASLAGLLGWLCWAGRFLKSSRLKSLRAWRHHGIPVRRFLLTTIALLSVVWCLLMSVVVGPDDWDAWAQWGPKAHIIAYGMGPLSDVQYFVPGSGDYPLLWPALWAFSAWCSGGWEDQWVKGWGAILLALVAWQMALVIKKNGLDGRWGGVAAALFLSMPAVPLIGSWAYAEPLFLLMTICAIGRLFAWRIDGHKSNILLAAGFTAGAALTKNEGLLFAIVCVIWFLMQDNSKHPFLALARFVFIILVLYTPWFIYRELNIHTQNHAMGGAAMGDLVLQAASRFGPALQHIGKIWSDVKQWNIAIPLLVLGAGYVTLFVPRARRDLIMPVILVAGYLFIMLIHPADLHWQIGAAWNRLTLHIFAVLMIVLAIHTPWPVTSHSDKNTI